MKRKIKGYDKDGDDHWRAKLECRHLQHMRHDPPLISRDWVLSLIGRREKLGVELNCKKCDEDMPKDF